MKDVLCVCFVSILFVYSLVVCSYTKERLGRDDNWGVKNALKRNIRLNKQQEELKVVPGIISGVGLKRQKPVLHKRLVEGEVAVVAGEEGPGHRGRLGPET